jgi:GNAT superfamily N-acetyltransferase
LSESTACRPRERLESFLARWRRKGLAGAALEAWTDRFSAERLYCFSGEIPSTPEAPAAGWRLLSPSEAEAWVARSLAKGEDMRMYQVALENAHLLFLAERDGREAGHVWVGRGWTYVPSPSRLLVRFHARTAYHYDQFVHPQHRRKGIAGSGLEYRLAVARAHGLARCSALMVRANRSARRNWSRLGIPGWPALRLALAGRSFLLPSGSWRRMGAEESRRAD